MESQKYLNQVAEGFENAIDEVINAVDGLSLAALNTPEGEGKWSMLQCIKHMSLATSVYVRNVDQKLSLNNLRASSGSFKGSWKGRLFVKTNAPRPGGKIPNKLKTFKSMEPQAVLDRQAVVDEFITTHQKFIELIKASQAVDLDRNKVATAIPIIKLRLGDAYGFILAHTQRHVVQLQRIKKNVTTLGTD